MKEKILICIYTVNINEKLVLDILEKIQKPIAKWDHEILILINSSGESIANAVSDSIKKSNLFNVRILFNLQNLGYGGNQKLAFHYAIKHNFDFALLLAGSGQYAPEQIESLVSALVETNSQAVVGSRFLNKNSDVKNQMPFYKYLGIKAITFFQNLVLGMNFSEFHSGFRVYRVKALADIPYAFNSNGRQFDTEILIQLKLRGFNIQEHPVSSLTGKAHPISDYIQYGLGGMWIAVKTRLHQMSLSYERKFDIGNISTDGYKDELKTNYPSSHQFAIAEVSEKHRVLDIGCGNALVGAKLKENGYYVEGIDFETPKEINNIDKFTQLNLNNSNLEIPASEFDYILLMDVLEHLDEPEHFVYNLRVKAKGKYPKIVVSVPNIGFINNRIQLLFGRFDYGIRGIMYLGHKRMFTFNAICKLFEQAEFKIIKCKGVPAPFPAAIGDNWISRLLLTINQGLIKILPRLFSYQIFLVAVPFPTLDDLLRNSMATMKQSDGMLKISKNMKKDD
jgi:2-polyprenyl-3-methyl-5-hydroxy-6-metoxy-1,4-benzoquinol methylase